MASMIGTNIWEILGIEPTTDISVIKKAYASRAKNYHPEEHPKEFQELRNAYKFALWLAKQEKETGKAGIEEPKETGKAGTEEPGKEEGTREADPKDADDNGHADSQDSFDYDFIINEETSQEQLEELFWKEFYAMIWHPLLRNDTDAWWRFLRQDKYEKLFALDDFRERFAENICGESIWEEGTVRFFDSFLKVKKFRDGNTMFYESKHSGWERLKHRSAKRILTFGLTRPTSEEILFYRKVPQKPLNFYFTYAALYGEKQKELYQRADRDRKQFRKKMIALIISVPVLISCLVIGGAKISNEKMIDGLYRQKLEQLQDREMERRSSEEEREADTRLDEVFEIYEKWQ